MAKDEKKKSKQHGSTPKEANTAPKGGDAFTAVVRIMANTPPVKNEELKRRKA